MKKGPETSAAEGLTKRVLLSLVVDVAELEVYTARVRAQVAALATVHEIEMPVAEAD